MVSQIRKGFDNETLGVLFNTSFETVRKTWWKVLFHHYHLTGMQGRWKHFIRVCNWHNQNLIYYHRLENMKIYEKTKSDLDTDN